MSLFLPDVNALLALLDPMHLHHDAAHRWYESQFSPRLLLCSHVENGVLRVASQPRYPNCLGTTARVREVLLEFVDRVPTERCDHDVSLLENALLDLTALTPSRVADLYLLALSVSHAAKFATFDRRFPASAISGGKAGLELIPI